jgi:hypothetical protein
LLNDNGRLYHDDRLGLHQRDIGYATDVDGAVYARPIDLDVRPYGNLGVGRGSTQQAGSGGEGQICFHFSTRMVEKNFKG